LIASPLTILLTVFNPLLLPVMYKAITYLAFRLVWIYPFYILTAYFLVDFFVTKTQKVSRRWLRTITFAVLAAAIVINVLPAFRQNTFSPETIAAERRASHLPWEDGLEFLRAALPERSVIASDPITSYTIDAFTPHYIVSTFDQHAPPNDLLVRARTMASRDILNPYNTASEKADLIAEYAVTHVVVNGRLHGDITIDYWMTNDASIPLIRKLLFGLPELFEIIYDKNGFLVLRCTRRKPSDSSPAQVPALLRDLPSEARTVGETAGLAILEAAQLDESREYQAGDTLGVTLYWSRRDPLSINKYVTTIRFDRVDTGQRFGNRLFPKVARKLEEFTEGKRYRFRSDHKILNGFFDPDLWPANRYVRDKALITIPGDVAEGRYTVRAKLLIWSTIPNIRVKDLLRDDDMFHGIEIGEISIGRP
jgi:hypothetical protein